MEKVFILPMDEIRIIKQIFIISELSNNDFSIGYILYEREINENYKFNEELSDLKKEFDYFSEYPKQDNYPKDNIDGLILQSVKNEFPKSYVKNHFLITTFDKERILTLKNIPTEDCIVDFTPDFSNEDLYKLIDKQFDGLNFNVKIYTDSGGKYSKNKRFSGYYKIEDKEILNKIQKIKFL